MQQGLTIDRRMLIAGAAAAPLLWSAAARATAPDLSALTSMTADVQPITAAERAARLARAQKLMKANRIDAVLIEPGASLVYFTGVRWGRSERLTAAVLPVDGPVLIVTPFFEEPSVRQTLGVEAEVRVWQEDQPPVALIAGWLKERKLTGAIGIEETARFFASDGLARALPAARIVSANPVVRGCRGIKSAAEISLMQKASDITIAAYRWTWPRVEKGMTPADIAALMNAATAKLGGDPGFALVLIGEAAAYPHGSRAPQRVAEGQIVLMDCGCSVEGYQSDISRTFVYGTPSAEQRRVWDHVAAGQQVAISTLR